MKTINLYTYLLLVLLLGTSCSKEKLSPESVIAQPNTNERTAELDNWIRDHITKPYNIEVVYRWDRHAFASSSYAYPPDEAKIRPMLELVKRLWIDVYRETTGLGDQFLHGKLPMRIYLFGGKGVDASGLELIASPHRSSLEMYIYDVNAFDATNPDRRYALARSLHHQFVRRLTEILPYDRDAFYRISQERYLSSPDLIVTIMAQDTSLRQRLGMRLATNRDGFTTLYAMLSPDADFAETFSAYICHTPTDMRDALIRAATPIVDNNDAEQTARNQVSAQEAHKRLKQKVEFVEQYCTKHLGISIRELQLKTLSALSKP